MEIFSEFIHEEIYLLKEPSASLGIVYEDPSEDDLILLDGILKAIQINENQIVRTKNIDSSKCVRWLVFSEAFTYKETVLEPYVVKNINQTTIILANPLAILRHAKNEKLKLWHALQQIFALE